MEIDVGERKKKVAHLLSSSMQSAYQACSMQDTRKKKASTRAPSFACINCSKIQNFLVVQTFVHIECLEV